VSGRSKTLRFERTSPVPASKVLTAAVDFSSRRPSVFPAVSMEHMTVHSEGESTADVTEGTFAGVGINWERCTYDWSQPGSVLATVTDSNVYAFPGSSWELRATPTDTGSSVEMIWTRTFRTTLRGRIFGTLYRLVGRPLFSRGVNQIMRNIERLEGS
jgi:hypothetical protein